MAARGDGSEKLDVDKKRILAVALEGERFAFGAFDFLDDEVGMKLDAHVAGGFGSDEIDFGGGRKRLANGVERCRDVVVGGKKIHRTRSLGMERRSGQRKEQQEHTDSV